jgi:hypothetical protein
MRINEISPLFTRSISPDEEKFVIFDILRGSTNNLAVYVNRLQQAISDQSVSSKILCESWFELEIMKDDLKTEGIDVSHSEQKLSEILQLLINSGYQKILSSIT